jgi:Ca2+-binding RTX toxin-like protein
MGANMNRTRRTAVLLGASLAAVGSIALAPSAWAAPAQVVPSQCPPVLAGYTIATPGPDVIEGNSLGDVICALDGNDVVDGNGGNDIIYGLRGSDSLHGNEAADELVGGINDDTLFGDGPLATLFDTNDAIKGGQATRRAAY